MKIARTVLTLLLLLTACSQNDGDGRTRHDDTLLTQPSVAATILPQRYFLRRLLGDSCQVMIMVPSGSSPELYSPSPNQMKRLAETDIYVRMGHLALETAWLEKFRSSSPDMTVVDPSLNIEFMTSHAHRHHDLDDHDEDAISGGIDPHIWLSPRLMIRYSRNLADLLIKEFPDRDEQIRSNLAQLTAEIERLDQEINALLRPHEGKDFVVFHPAWSYFAKDYTLRQWAIEDEGKSPSPQHMKEMADLVKNKKIQTIFIQNQFERRSAQTVAESLGISLIELDPLLEDWPTMMKNIARAIAASYKTP